MKNYGISQLWVRIALAFAFLSAVADRLGYWGAPGSPNVTWGNWENFLRFSNQLNFFVSESIGQVLAITATGLEVVLAFLLLIGLNTRVSAYAAGILLTLFALTMSLSLGIKSTFDFSVWVGAGASFLLGSLNSYPYSLDQWLINTRRKKESRFKN